MTTQMAVDDLRSRILSHYALLFLVTWEEERWEHALRELTQQAGLGFATWSVTQGLQPRPADTETPLCEPLELLDHLAQYHSNHVFLLRDFHPCLSDPRVVRRIRDLIPVLLKENKTLLLMGPEGNVPFELRKDAVQVELPLPNLDEMRVELQSVLDERAASSQHALHIEPEQEERLLKAVLGLTAKQARKALSRALLDCEQIDEHVFALLVAEKKGMIQGSDLLEFQELQEGMGDIGGLAALKDWVVKRAEAFSARAQEQGIPSPKGVLLLGVQGCGKSLTARAIARLLSFPLIRLDVSALLSSDTGASEKNMRDVLNLMEMIAPAILWLDEIEKGFAGADGEQGQDAVMVRLMGKFLTWMQENSKPVFVVATANSVAGLPPEMLRRGRFDELFFVDLPNYHERKDIIEIHMKKRDWDTTAFDIARLAEKTEGFSGAEIEQIVLSAMVENFGKDAEVTDEDLEKARDDTVPLSVTMEEKIFQLREWARGRCRPATPDSRVLQMLEAEQRERREELATAMDDESSGHELTVPEEWREEAESGDFNSAIVEFVRQRDRTTVPEIREALSEYLTTDGEQGLSLRSDPNVVLCVGLSGDVAGALAKLVTEKKLYLHPAPFDMYGAISRGIRLPLLEQLTDERQSRPCLFPVCLSDMAPEPPNERLFRVARMKLNR